MPKSALWGFFDAICNNNNFSLKCCLPAPQNYLSRQLTQRKKSNIKKTSNSMPAAAAPPTHPQCRHRHHRTTTSPPICRFHRFFGCYIYGSLYSNLCLSVSPLRSIETVFRAMHMAIDYSFLVTSPTCSNFQ